jgi:transcriptional regulator with XRE-family HTH domain
MIIQYVIGDYVTLGQKLKSLREGKALTQTQLSEELNCLISQGKLSDIENDKRIVAENEKVKFIVDHFLAILLFCYITEKNIFIGHAGDGVIMKDNVYKIIDQNSKPYYPAYRCIKKEYLEIQDTSNGPIWRKK